MATLTPVFCSESNRVHHDHAILVEELRALDQALDQVHGNGHSFESLAAAKQAQFLGRHLAAELPEHFLREEQTVLALVEQVSPELATFSREMKVEHQDIRRRLNSFCRLADELETAEDLDAALGRFRAEGHALTRELGRHIALEEHELSGFL
jgi:iron-sulfur cluster repair protein YtfE (RIC family)